MSSSRAMESEKKLPPRIQVRTKKDQLYNDVVSFFEKNGWEWTTGGVIHMGRSLYSNCKKLSGTSMDTINPLLIDPIPYLLSSKVLLDIHVTPLSFQNIERGHTPTWVQTHWRGMQVAWRPFFWAHGWRDQCGTLLGKALKNWLRPLKATVLTWMRKRKQWYSHCCFWRPCVQCVESDKWLSSNIESYLWSTQREGLLRPHFCSGFCTCWSTRAICPH